VPGKLFTLLRKRAAGKIFVKISEFLYNGSGDTMKDTKIKKIPYARNCDTISAKG
jgi:hypothetical protein